MSIGRTQFRSFTVSQYMQFKYFPQFRSFAAKKQTWLCLVMRYQQCTRISTRILPPYSNKAIENKKSWIFPSRRSNPALFFLHSFLSLTCHQHEIKCPKCEMSIRSQGCNIKSTYERLMNENGCIGCGNHNLIIREVDMSRMAEVQAARKAKMEAEKK